MIDRDLFEKRARWAYDLLEGYSGEWKDILISSENSSNKSAQEVIQNLRNMSRNTAVGELRHTVLTYEKKGRNFPSWLMFRKRRGKGAGSNEEVEFSFLLNRSHTYVRKLFANNTDRSFGVLFAKLFLHELSRAVWHSFELSNGRKETVATSAGVLEFADKSTEMQEEDAWVTSLVLFALAAGDVALHFRANKEDPDIAFNILCPVFD